VFRGDFEMATFVLVHGAWHGAWCWRRVARLLARDGHEVVTPTLTGLAERSHLLTPDIGLDTHVLDVVNEMKWRELTDVVLVGHSYAGLVISGVAEAMEKSIASFVLLDAFFPESEQALVDLAPPPVRDAFLEAERDGAVTIAPRSAAMFKVNERDRAWVDAQCTPQPVKCGLQKMALTGARERIARKSYIRATAYPNVAFDPALAKARARGWRTYEVDCGHDVMIDAPERLAEILLGTFID
jgi:pimeloyl-ACP methyl ester carboxylesterase